MQIRKTCVYLYMYNICVCEYVRFHINTCLFVLACSGVSGAECTPTQYDLFKSATWEHPHRCRWNTHTCMDGYIHTYMYYTSMYVWVYGASVYLHLFSLSYSLCLVKQVPYCFMWILFSLHFYLTVIRNSYVLYMVSVFYFVVWYKMETTCLFWLFIKPKQGCI